MASVYKSGTCVFTSATSEEMFSHACGNVTANGKNFKRLFSIRNYVLWRFVWSSDLKQMHSTTWVSFPAIGLILSKSRPIKQMTAPSIRSSFSSKSSFSTTKYSDSSLATIKLSVFRGDRFSFGGAACGARPFVKKINLPYIPRVLHVLLWQPFSILRRVLLLRGLETKFKKYGKVGKICKLSEDPIAHRGHSCASRSRLKCH